MPCPQCGALLAIDAARCDRCGAVIEPRPSGAMRRGPAGIPFDQYSISAYGPPIAPDPLLRAPDLIDELPPPRKFIGYRPVVAPLPLPMRRHRGRVVLIVFIVALLVVSGLLIAVSALHVGAGLHFGPVRI